MSPSLISARGVLLLATLPTTTLHAQEAAFNGTLAEYLALGDEGVAIGEAIFSDFQLLPLQQGASGFRSDFIDLVPVNLSSGPGFRFDVMDGATADDFFQLRFSFRVSGVFIDRASLTLGQVNVRDDSNGGVDTLVDLSALDAEPGSLGTLISFVGPGGSSDLETSDQFTAVDDLTVEIDAVIDGGGSGRPGEIVASIGSISLGLGKSAAPPAPTDLAIHKAGLLNPSTYFIEFTSEPNSAHVVTTSESPDSGFSTEVQLSSGTGATDSYGFARVEFPISSYGPSQFFRVEKSI